MNFIVILLGVLFFYNCGLKNEKNDDNIISHDWLGNYTNDLEVSNNNHSKKNKPLTEEEKKLRAFFNSFSEQIQEENRETARIEVESIFKKYSKNLAAVNEKFEEESKKIFDKYEEMRKSGSYTKKSKMDQELEIKQANKKLDIGNKIVALIKEKEWKDFVKKYSIKLI